MMQPCSGFEFRISLISDYTGKKGLHFSVRETHRKSKLSAGPLLINPLKIIASPPHKGTTHQRYQH
jgi:hypothetical protein